MENYSGRVHAQIILDVEGIQADNIADATQVAQKKARDVLGIPTDGRRWTIAKIEMRHHPRG
jgi:hypothetical protein